MSDFYTCSLAVRTVVCDDVISDVSMAVNVIMRQSVVRIIVNESLPPDSDFNLDSTCLQGLYGH